MAAAEQKSPPSEASVKELLAFARYGARIDKDISRTLQTLRVLRDRPDAWIDELRERTLNRGQRHALAAMRRKWAA
jgi:hypothetical protein